MSLPRLRLDQIISLLLILIFASFHIETLPDSATNNFLQLLKPPPATATVTTPQLKDEHEEPPLTTARGVMIYDPVNGAIIYQKDAQLALPIASLTKLMTALVATEIYNPNDVITIDGEENTEGNTIKLQRGEQITVHNLLHGLLIFSGNDAAYALANHHPGGLPGFIDSMNKRAQELHLYQTSFENPAGFDTANQFSSAYDIAILMKEVTQHPELRQIMDSEFENVTSVDGKYTHAVYNTNELLKKIPEIVAGKTGSTPMAKECLTTRVEKDGNAIITVVLGSDDRFGETEKLIHWVYKNATWTTISFGE